MFIFCHATKNEPNENMFRCAKQQVFLARKASIAQSANEKRCAHGAAALMNPASSRATDDAPRRLTRTRPDACGTFAFAASKRTAKTEKLTRTGIEALLGLLGGTPRQFKPRERGYEIRAKPSPLGRVAARRADGRGYYGENREANKVRDRSVVRFARQKFVTVRAARARI